MKIAIVYNSQTGFTERYAELIAGKTNSELIRFRGKKLTDVSGYDVLVFGSYILAEKIAQVEWFDSVRGGFKASYLFVTGASPAENYPELEEYKKREKDRGHDFFYMPGGLNYERMSAPMRFMMKNIFLRMVRKNYGEESSMYQMVKDSYSLFDEKYAMPLIRELEKLN